MNIRAKSSLIPLFSLLFGCAGIQIDGNILSKGDVDKIARRHDIDNVVYYKEFKGRDAIFLYLYSNLRDQSSSGWCLSDYTFVEVDPHDFERTRKGDKTNLASARACGNSEQGTFFPVSGLYIDSLVFLMGRDINSLNSGLISKDKIKCIDESKRVGCVNGISLDMDHIKSLAFRSSEELKVDFYGTNSSYSSVIFLYRQGELEKVTFEPEL